LARALVQTGLIDEYRLVVHPVVLGAGERLFTAPLTIEPISTTTFSGGAVAHVFAAHPRPSPSGKRAAHVVTAGQRDCSPEKPVRLRAPAHAQCRHRVAALRRRIMERRCRSGHDRALVARIAGQIHAICGLRPRRPRPARIRLPAGSSGRFGTGVRLSENRGVPGSSPGLAIEKPRGRPGFLLSGVRGSCIRLGHGLGHAARWVSRFERRTPDNSSHPRRTRTARTS
jgi:hypothetical protein